MTRKINSSGLGAKRLISRVHTCGQVFTGLVMIFSFYFATTSAFGKYYNPLMVYLSEFIGWISPNVRLPVTIQDASKLFTDDGFYSVGNYGLALIYIIAMIFVQFYIYTYVAARMSNVFEEVLIINKLGKEFHQRYCRMNNFRRSKKESEVKSESDLELASRKHWEEWTKHYKSNMGYDEWISRVKKGL
ncbi:hypothetical protein H1Z99_004922 [Salmonella enterica subsp. enterica serovar Meleagridis]|nr:hypothetical protein [Salmonella enterica subsp. enterica serovar Cerro]EGD4263647.1 hypothetical protein [Salmonella enterica subsp. enterica serovar Cerro]EGD4267998.1 hypothetical protein [Salmonella enterica subsp. enterica serovar Cerro]EGD4276642.1 hypothetical protein [Salmonella enterica subsp. enterica serovar Meleagridis]EGD4286645.1 hypothetical protein [Salmonella enterica subsp. enterica serovar Meleagridis]